jgi:hypothetical protein
MVHKIEIDDETYEKLIKWMGIPRGMKIETDDMRRLVDEHETLARIFYEAHAEVEDNFNGLVDKHLKAQELVGRT